MYSARSSSRTRPSTGGGGIRTTSSLLATLSANVLGKAPDSKGPTRVGDTNRPNSARCTAADTQRPNVLPTRKQATTVAPRSVLPAAPRAEAPKSNDLFREPPRERMQVRPPTVAVGETTQLFRRASTVVASTSVAPTPTTTTTTVSPTVSPPPSTVVAPVVVKTVVKPEIRTSPVVMDSPKVQTPTPTPKPLAVEKVPAQAPQVPTHAVSTEAVMERRHTGQWVREFPKMGYFACVGCTTPVAGSKSKVPSVKGYATFSSYFEPSVELGVVVPQMGVGDSFVAITCIKCKSFLGRLCTDEVEDRLSDDLSQFNSKALKYVASPVPGGFEGPVVMDDRVGRRRRNKGSVVEESTSGTDSDDADDDLWSSMRNRASR